MAKMKRDKGKAVSNPPTKKVKVGSGKSKKTGGMGDACAGVKMGSKKGGGKKM